MQVEMRVSGAAGGLVLGAVLLALSPPLAAEEGGKAAAWPKLKPPKIGKVRWQTFEKWVDYVVADAKGRTWLLLKDKGGDFPQYVCHEAPDVHLQLRGGFLTLGVDKANRLWVATYGRLYCWDLNTYKKLTKPLEGFFPARVSDGWPIVHPGQVWVGHSAARVYCHGPRGVHVLDGGQWSYHRWRQAERAGPGVVNLAAANLQHVEGADGLTFTWGDGDCLQGFWTHDGHVWRHYSSKRIKPLAKLTAVVPVTKTFALVCTTDRPAFPLDLTAGASSVPPTTAAILAQLLRLGSKDAQTRAAAEKAVMEMADVAGDKVAEAASFLTDGRLRHRAAELVRKADEASRSRPASRPTAPKDPLYGARLLARTPRGDALLTWQADGRTRMGVLRPNRKIVETPPAMPIKSRRPYR